MTVQKIYKNQDVQIVMPCNEVLTGATILVKYRTPLGNLGTVEVFELSGDGKEVAFDFKPTSVGYWKFWLQTTWIGGKVIPSTPIEMMVWEEGT